MNWKQRISGGCPSCQCPQKLDKASAANRCPLLGPPMDFVWLYIASGAKGDELRFSIRSVFKNYLGLARIWIVGDKPDWYRGLHVPLDRVSRTAGWPRIDRANKFYGIATGKNGINEQFVAMQDDIYFVNPVAFFDLGRRWVNDRPLTPEKVNNWQPKNAYLKQKKRTAEALFKNGIHYVSDYSTHTPKLYSKGQLRTVIEQYDALHVPLVCTILFDNAMQRPGNVYPIQPYRVRLKSKDHSEASLLEACREKIFLNHLDQSWTNATRSALEVLFPRKSPVES